MTRISLIIKSLLNDLQFSADLEANQKSYKLIALLITRFPDTSMKVDDDQIQELFDHIFGENPK